MNNLLLDLLRFGSIVSRILVITSKNPVISVLFLISVFVNAACYLLVLGVGFIGVSYLIVYVGAIAILFLFVIIMLNIQLTEIISVGKEYTKNLPLGLLVGSLFLFEILSIMPNYNNFFSELPINLFNKFNSKLLGINNYINNNKVNFIENNYADQNINEFLQIERIGQNLYTNNSLWLFIRSLILLLAMLGPIMLCLRKN